MSEEVRYQAKSYGLVLAEFYAGAVFFRFVGEHETYTMSEELFRRLFTES